MDFVTEPRIRANPNPHVPLAAIVEFTTDRPSRAVLSVSGRCRTWRLEADPGPKAAHRIPVVGMRPGEACRIEVSIEADGVRKQAPRPLAYRAPQLPDDFPPMEVRVCKPDEREPGAMMFNVRYTPASAHLPALGLLAVVDRFGEIVWTYHLDEAIGDVRRLANGNILYVCDGRIHEIDWLGDNVATWYSERNWTGKPLPAGAIPVDAEVFHHSAIEMPSGNFLACSIEVREIENFPTSETDPGAETETAKVIGDVIVEFRRDGTVVNRYPILDLLDQYRICYDSLDSYWIRRGYPDSRDWDHLNCVAYRAEDDLIVASLRHQDCLIGIDRGSGELSWILGNHDNWRQPWSDKLLTPEDGLEWAYHQHDCTFTPSGSILCFDNGNHRAEPFAPRRPDTENHSRVVEFEVDAARKTVREVWARGKDEDGAFSVFQSGVVRLPRTGNMFIDYGGICTLEGVPTTDVLNSHCMTRLIEVTVSDPQEVVFELVVNDDSPKNARALSSFRAEHFPGFGESAN